MNPLMRGRTRIVGIAKIKTIVSKKAGTNKRRAKVSYSAGDLLGTRKRKGKKR